MDNKQVTAEWIAQQRQISEIVNMTYEDVPGSVVPLLKRLEKSQTAALDALEASMKREAEKASTIAHLTAERDAALRRAEAAVKCIRDVETYGELGSLAYMMRTIAKWRGPEPGSLSEEALRDATELIGGPPDGYIICGPDNTEGGHTKNDD